MALSRSSGLLLHITSLPGPYGIGDLGSEAYRFIDFLAASHQTWWQVLPLSPLGYGNSPYASTSAFAGNPLLISPGLLIDEGYLLASEVTDRKSVPDDKVDFSFISHWKESKLRIAFNRFKIKASPKDKKAFQTFCKKNAEWLEPFAFFQILKNKNQLRHWLDWKVEDPAKIQKESGADLDYVRFVQYIFDKQWQKLRAYAKKKKIKIIGDVPIFVALDSVDVWAHPPLFHLNSDNRPTFVAGVPPDYFSAEGQLWGNPLYDWNHHKQTNFAWWISRFKRAFTLFDGVRLDHFIGFHRSWAVPANATTAREGTWMFTPGKELFDAVLAAIKKATFVAEDLGLLTPEVENLRDHFKFPGMHVLQFDFGDPDAVDRIRPFQYKKNSVVYTGTHDNNTTVGWLNEVKNQNSENGELSTGQKERAYALQYCGSDGIEPHWDLIRLALACPANIAMIPVQDILGLDSSARMNTPGRASDNWEWRLRDGMLTLEIAKRLAEVTDEFKRRKK